MGVGVAPVPAGLQRRHLLRTLSIVSCSQQPYREGEGGGVRGHHGEPVALVQGVGAVPAEPKILCMEITKIPTYLK